LLKHARRIAGLLAGFWLVSVFAHAQTPPAATGQTPPAPSSQAPAPSAPAALLRVFVDCDQCDAEYLRQNVQFVDYVRDRAVADIHVLVTTESTGGGGQSWVVKFIGVGPLQGQDRSLSFTTIQTATDDDRRKEFARVFRIGLVAYAAATPAFPRLDVTWKGQADTPQTTARNDPWNFWVFRVNTNGNMNGEESSKSLSLRMNFSANRTTEQWKINLDGNASQNKNTFEVPEDNLRVDTVTNSWNVNMLVVKSVGPKLSTGIAASLNHSSFSNNDRSFTIRPAVEYDFFRYSESAQRKVAIQYGVGVSRFNYRELTVYDKLEETIPNHQVVGVIAFRQPWGSLQVQSEFAQHLNTLAQYHATVFGETDVRLFKGFSFNFFGEYERIRDQTSLRKGATSPEEVLLRIRQLATGYSYFFSFGVSYSFGSIYNSVVNTRFSGF